ncbi:MAG: DUF3656 domain-containing protein, partial [Anaerolineae bacterium]
MTVDKAAKPFTQANTPVYRQPVDVQVVAREGQPLGLTWVLSKNPEINVYVQSDEPLTRANSRSVNADYLHQQLGRLGNTAYRLENLTTDIEGDPFIPSSLLNRLRQEAVESLIQQQADASEIFTADPIGVLDDALFALEYHSEGMLLDAPRLHLLVRTPEQLEAALEIQPASITLDYLDLYGLSPAVERIKEAGITARVASPRILKPDEQRVVNFLLRLDCPLVVRSGGLLEALQGRHQHPLIGDFS